eukprot:GHRR01013233.1.p1 GENE.GHRR01013233.1~~GHRR01013233.1.p1  ORF type:complete len:863 (+),score=345.89 GHRR01013233.1:1839-4427(+)
MCIFQCQWYSHARAQVGREVQIHVRLHHPNIASLYAAFEDPERVYLVQVRLQEQQEQQELSGHHTPLLLDSMGSKHFLQPGNVLLECSKYAQHVHLSACSQPLQSEFCAAATILQGIIHRDIKPENILLGEGDALKLADFGLAIDSRLERAVTRAGTLDYMAPEVLVCPDKRQPEENKDKVALSYGRQVDAWAVGCLACELVTGVPPFESESRSTTYQLIMYREPKLPGYLSVAAKSFIIASLAKNSTDRATCSQLLQHEWIITNCAAYKAAKACAQSKQQAAKAAAAATPATEAATEQTKAEALFISSTAAAARQEDSSTAVAARAAEHTSQSSLHSTCTKMSLPLCAADSSSNSNRAIMQQTSSSQLNNSSGSSPRGSSTPTAGERIFGDAVQIAIAPRQPAQQGSNALQVATAPLMDLTAAQRAKMADVIELAAVEAAGVAEPAADPAAIVADVATTPKQLSAAAPAGIYTDITVCPAAAKAVGTSNESTAAAAMIVDAMLRVSPTAASELVQPLAGPAGVAAAGRLSSSADDGTEAVTAMVDAVANAEQATQHIAAGDESVTSSTMQHNAAAAELGPTQAESASTGAAESGVGVSAVGGSGVPVIAAQSSNGRYKDSDYVNSARGISHNSYIDQHSRNNSNNSNNSTYGHHLHRVFYPHDKHRRSSFSNIRWDDMIETSANSFSSSFAASPRPGSPIVDAKRESLSPLRLPQQGSAASLGSFSYGHPNSQSRIAQTIRQVIDTAAAACQTSAVAAGVPKDKQGPAALKVFQASDFEELISPIPSQPDMLQSLGLSIAAQPAGPKLANSRVSTVIDGVAGNQHSDIAIIGEASPHYRSQAAALHIDRLASENLDKFIST